MFNSKSGNTTNRFKLEKKERHGILRASMSFEERIKEWKVSIRETLEEIHNEGYINKETLKNMIDEMDQYYAKGNQGFYYPRIISLYNCMKISDGVGRYSS